MKISRLLKIYKNPFTSVTLRRYGRCDIARSVKIKGSDIYVADGAELIIEDGVVIEGTSIYVAEGSLHIKQRTILYNTNLTIENGSVMIADHSMIRAKRFWVRFGGKLSVGSYTNINEGSEIRCDMDVRIGSFCQISYNVNIWDTNTHSILSKDERRDTTIKKFPCFGYESSRPVSKPVFIGDDCWIGMNATILKGSEIGDETIVAYGTIIAGKVVPPKSTVSSNIDLRISSR